MKTVIITGGNSGLGYYCAQEIARRKDWYVIIACRNQDKATQAVKKLREETSSNRLATMLLDLASLASIRQFAQELLQSDYQHKYHHQRYKLQFPFLRLLPRPLKPVLFLFYLKPFYTPFK